MDKKAEKGKKNLVRHKRVFSLEVVTPLYCLICQVHTKTNTKVSTWTKRALELKESKVQSLMSAFNVYNLKLKWKEEGQESIVACFTSCWLRPLVWW